MTKMYESMWDRHLGQISVFKYQIVLNFPNPPLMYSYSYGVGLGMRKLEREEVKEAGVAVPAATEWVLPVVFVSKKDESLSFCVDYRRINAVTVQYSYFNSRMDESIASPGKGKNDLHIGCELRILADEDG